MDFPSGISKNAQQSSLTDINSLPDELILQIVKLSASSEGRGKGAIYDHNFILNIISKISNRFRRISADSSLWKGSTAIRASQKDVSFAINHCIHLGTTFLKVRTMMGEDISNAEIMTVYRKCRNLEGLDLIIGRSVWPSLPSPWRSLRVLSLHLPKVIPNPEFGGQEFHNNLPNLAELTVCTPMPFDAHYCR